MTSTLHVICRVVNTEGKHQEATDVLWGIYVWTSMLDSKMNTNTGSSTFKTWLKNAVKFVSGNLGEKERQEFIEKLTSMSPMEQDRLHFTMEVRLFSRKAVAKSPQMMQEGANGKKSYTPDATAMLAMFPKAKPKASASDGSDNAMS